MNPPVPGPHEPDREDDVARLVGRAYRPEAPDPAFAGRVRERLAAEAAAIRAAHARPAAPARRFSPWRLYAAVGVGAAAAMAGGVLFVTSNQAELRRGPGVADAPETVRNDHPAAAAGPPPAAADDWTGFDALDGAEKEKVVDAKSREAIAAGDAERLRSLHEQLATPRFQPVANVAKCRMALVENALRIDPRLDWAQEAFEADHAWLRSHPLFRDSKFVVSVAKPYVVWQEYEEITGERAHLNPERVAKAVVTARRESILLNELHRRFRELLAEPLAMPELPYWQQPLSAVVMWNHESFVEVLLGAESRGMKLPRPARELRSFYSPSARKVFTYVGDDSLRALDEFPVAGGRVQKHSDQVLCHEGTHQLLAEYAAAMGARAGADAPAERPSWLDEGFAEFMGAIEVGAADKETLAAAAFEHNRLLGARVMQVVGDGKSRTSRAHAALWTIGELLRPTSVAQVDERAAELHPAGPSEMSQLFWARSWGLVHFLWYYDEGKYRGRLLEVLAMSVRGDEDADAIARRVRAVADPALMEREFEWYWDRCCARRFGWKDTARGKPWDTETSAPTGRYVPPDTPK